MFRSSGGIRGDSLAGQTDRQVENKDSRLGQAVDRNASRVEHVAYRPRDQVLVSAQHEGATLDALGQLDDPGNFQLPA
jgi:hypothetical protein